MNREGPPASEDEYETEGGELEKTQNKGNEEAFFYVAFRWGNRYIRSIRVGAAHSFT
jgi:hypothetical protein